MIRFFFRVLGLFLLAAAFVALIYDGTRSIAASEVTFTPLNHLWLQLHGASLQWLQAAAEQRAPGWVWDPGAQAIIGTPAFAVLGVLGALFMLLGRKKRPLIGYAR